MGTMWHPNWWSETHASAWDRVKEAMHRDWEQTKHDLSSKSGHELNQGVADTVRQATGSEAIPPNERPNPPKVIGSWDEAEVPLGYGYGARQMYGAEHPVWNEGVELRLRSEWESSHAASSAPWRDVSSTVRRGYEYRPKS